jgi:acylpyruvate hydrolase
VCSSVRPFCLRLACTARYVGNAVPSTPVLFLKPASSLIVSGSSIELPQGVTSLHHEIELGVVIGRHTRDVRAADAMNHVKGYVLALDLTARNLQDAAKKAGLPWTVAKGQDTFCPISAFVPRDAVADPQQLELWCAVNGKERQRGRTSDMLFPVAKIIEYVSSMFTLDDGDLILTGTPAGVGPIAPGDTVTGGITGRKQFDISFPVTTRPKAKL